MGFQWCNIEDVKEDMYDETRTSIYERCIFMCDLCEIDKSSPIKDQHKTQHLFSLVIDKLQCGGSIEEGYGSLNPPMGNNSHNVFVYTLTFL